MLKIEFKDQGQDILYLYIDTDGTIRHCGPFHNRLYQGSDCTNHSILEVGGRVMITGVGHDARNFRWPIAAISEAPLTEINHVRRGKIKGYVTSSDGSSQIEIILAQDVHGKTASDLWRTGETVMFDRSFLVVEKPKRQKATIPIDQPQVLIPDKPHKQDKDSYYNPDRHEKDYHEID